MTVHSMFSVPLIHYEINNWPTNKKRILDALPELTDAMLDGNVYTDFFLNMEDEDVPSYGDTIIDIITPYLKDFTDQRKVEFTDMWFQQAYQGHNHGIHNHEHSGWSAIMYVEFDPRFHSATQFYSPWLNPWNGRLEVFEPPVNEGQLIIFPSTIAHEALANNTDKRRTIVSFNLRGKVDRVKRSMWQGDPIVKVYAAHPED